VRVFRDGLTRSLKSPECAQGHTREHKWIALVRESRRSLKMTTGGGRGTAATFGGRESTRSGTVIKN
jgi:hypothetical protein